MLKQISTYNLYPTYYLENTTMISRINENTKHIQILFRRRYPVGHFICTFYDGNASNIYDFLNNKELHKDFVDFLSKLHPYCFNNPNKPIIF